MTQLKVEWDVEQDNDVPITGYILEADLNQNGMLELAEIKTLYKVLGN